MNRWPSNWHERPRMTRTHHTKPHFATRHATDIQRRCYHQNAGLWHVQRQHIQLSVSWLCQQTRGPGTACPRRHQALGLHTDPQLSHLRARNRTATHYFYLHRTTALKPLAPQPLTSCIWLVAHSAPPTHPTKTRTFSSTWATRMATCTCARSFHIALPYCQHSPRVVLMGRAEIHQALMMSRSMYVEQCTKPVELPKEVGKGSQGTSLKLLPCLSGLRGVR